MKNVSKVKFAIGMCLASLLLIAGCAPYISSFTPEEGPTGTLITINGGRYKPTPAENTVKIGGIAVPTTDVTVISTSSIKAKVPVGAQTGLITISTSKGTGKSKKNFVVPSAEKWTFMVYLDADNNLESAGIDDFLEMASVGSTAQVNIIVQMDRINGYNSTNGDWTGTRRFLIQSGDTPSMVPLADMGELNMGDPAVLQDFVEWGITNYPAEHYALSIWNHGDGWRKNFENIEKIPADNEPPVKAVASDDTDGDILYMREVQDALTTAKKSLESKGNTNVKIDVIGFDACLMGMVEVGYAMRDVCNFMIGSEELEPGDGWPYNTILNALTATPNMTAETLATTIVTNYNNSYGSDVTQAAYDLSKMTALAVKIDGFVSKANIEWAIMKNARNNSRDYHPWGNSCWGIDLWDFADEVFNNVADADIKTAASELKVAIDDFVSAEAHSANMSGSHGVAIYFPKTLADFNNDPQHTGYEESNTFMKVDFVDHHQWDNWLKDYYANIP